MPRDHHGEHRRSPAGHPSIVLTGFMGTGKTTVGRLLARDLGYDFVDTDWLIEQRHGAIADIFAQRGEGAFREIERQVAAELGTRRDLVVATGGRMLLDPDNLRALAANGRIFCLVATPDEIIDRLSRDAAGPERPLLAVADPRRRVVELMSERQAGYRRFAQVATGGRSPQAVAGELQALASSERRLTVVSPAGPYEVLVGVAVLPLVRSVAEIDGPVVVLADQRAADLYLPNLGVVDLVIRLPPGHSRQTPPPLAVVRQALARSGVDRDATLVALGSADVAQVAGLAAGACSGGPDVVHCPTDLVAMAAPQRWERVGAAQPPRAVIADVATLQALEPAELAAGLAVVVERGLIGGPDLVSRLEAGEWMPAPGAGPAPLGPLVPLVARAIEVGDAIAARPAGGAGGPVRGLADGWARAIEHVTGGALDRQAAMGVALVGVARLSERAGLARLGLGDRVAALVSHVGSNPRLPERLGPGTLAGAVRRDLAARGPGMVLLRDIGDPVVTTDVERADLVAVAASLNP